MSDKTLSIHPPEGVPIGFALASIGSRFGAQLIDILLTYGGLLLLFWFLFVIEFANFTFVLTLFFLLVFLIRIPYYIFSELVWNGRTLGKKITTIRVISADGTRLTPYQVTARNLMKEVEVFLPAIYLLGFDGFSGLTSIVMFFWMVGVLLIPLINKKNQRLGDMIAGTLVVEQPKTVLLPDLAVQAISDRAAFVFSKEQLGIYGRFELQALEQILREPPKTPEATTRLEAVAKTIRRKISFEDKIAAADYWDFLSDFYRQQREFLESRHLFGDTRENKFHDVAPSADIKKPSDRKKRKPDKAAK